MRLLLVLCLVISTGCGSRDVSVLEADGAPPSDSSVAEVAVHDTLFHDTLAHDGLAHDALATDHAAEDAFCSGEAKAVLNGSQLDVLQVTGEVIAMGCCDGAAVRFAAAPAGPSSSPAMTLVAGIRKFAGQNPIAQPTILDLADLPDGWDVMVSHYPCHPATQCYDELTAMGTMHQDQFQGWIELNGTSFYDGSLRVTLCLEGSAGPTSQGAVQSVRLFARDVEVPTLP